MTWERVAGGRPCTVCLGLRGLRVAASHVARAADGLEWFECGQHEPTENVARVLRVRLTPIAEWFASMGLPMPTEAEAELDAGADAVSLASLLERDPEVQRLAQDFYQFATGGRVDIVSADPAATARWLREIEIESDRDDLLPHFTD